MTENNFNSEIEKLKSEIELKDKEIRKYLDQIETLEDTIMDMEVNVSEKSGKSDSLILTNQIKHLENYNRELKDKMGFLRLENIRLNKELEQSKKGLYNQLSLIKVVEKDSFTNASKEFTDSDLKIKKSQSAQNDSFKNIQVRCPICETQKTLKIPANLINPSQNDSVISIPKEYVCEHSFQILLNKSFTVKKYQIGNYDVNKIELSNKELLTPEIISKIKEFIDDREILGAAIFDDDWNVIFASIPSESIISLFKEIHLRKETQIRDMIKIYIELKNQQKIFLEYIEIFGSNYVLVLLFSQKVNFGIGTMLFKDIKDKLQKFGANHKEGII